MYLYGSKYAHCKIFTKFLYNIVQKSASCFFQQHFELRIWFDQYNAPQPQFQVQCLVKVVVIKQKQNMRNHSWLQRTLFTSFNELNQLNCLQQTICSILFSVSCIAANNDRKSRMFKRNSAQYLISQIPRFTLTLANINQLGYYDEILDVRGKDDFFLDHISRPQV